MIAGRRWISCRSPQIPRRCSVCTGHAKVRWNGTVELQDWFVRSTALQCGMADNRTISQLEAEGYASAARAPCGCRSRCSAREYQTLSAMTLDQLGAKMRCDKCGKRPERY